MFTNQFFKRWVIATILGWLLGFTLVVALAFAIESIGLSGYQFFIGIGIGLGVGYMQGRIMQFYLGIGHQWMIASTVGMGLAFTLFDLGNALFTVFPEYNLLSTVALGGVLTGLAQYFILKKQFQNAVLWIPISLIGWTLAGGLIRLSEVIEKTGLSGLPAALIVLVILTVGASSVLGLITGFGLKKIVD